MDQRQSSYKWKIRVSDQQLQIKTEREFAPDSFERINGFRFFLDENHNVTITCPIKKQHLNRRGDVHGGLIAALADTATGVALSTFRGELMPCATIELDVKFIKAARTGTLTALPRVLRRGGRFGFVECDIVDDNRALIAKATGTFAMMPGASPSDLDDARHISA